MDVCKKTHAALNAMVGTILVIVSVMAAMVGYGFVASGKAADVSATVKADLQTYHAIMEERDVVTKANFVQVQNQIDKRFASVDNHLEKIADKIDTIKK